MDDWQLLDDYVTRNSEDAFRTLVERHGAMVYHVALRRVGDRCRAEEITQAVFIALARKAGRLPRGTLLSGWLFRATRFAVLNMVREDSRRKRYEQEASVAETLVSTGESECMEQGSIVLIDALEALPRRDREVILVRFFEDKSHRQIAETLGISEAAARVRVSRAVEKLRVIFSKRGFAAPSASLLCALSAQTAAAVPKDLASSVAAASLIKCSGTSAFSLSSGILKSMMLAQVKSLLLILGAVLFVGALSGVVFTSVRNSHGVQQPIADRTTPRGTMLVMYEALESGDAKGYVDCVWFRTADDVQLKPVFEAFVQATGRFNRELSKQFGAEAAGREFTNFPFVLPREAVASGTENIHGDSATVSFATGKGGRPIEFSQANGKWRMAADGFLHLNAGILKDLYARVTRSLNETAPEIPQGKYRTAAAAVEAMKQRAR